MVSLPWRRVKAANHNHCPQKVKSWPSRRSTKKIAKLRTFLPAKLSTFKYKWLADGKTWRTKVYLEWTRNNRTVIDLVRLYELEKNSLKTLFRLNHVAVYQKPVERQRVSTCFPWNMKFSASVFSETRWRFSSKNWIYFIPVPSERHEDPVIYSEKTGQVWHDLGLREEYDGPTGLVLILYGRKVQTMEGESNKYSITCIVKISRLISSGQYFKIRYQLHSGQVAKVMIQTYKLTNTIGRSIWKNSLYVFVVRKSFKKCNFWVLHMIFSYFLSRW